MFDLWKIKFTAGNSYKNIFNVQQVTDCILTSS